jgi:translation initiation factor 6 (eIF-6)
VLVDLVHSGFENIVRASGFEMGVGRFSKPLNRVGVLAMPDARLDKTRRIESVCMVPLGAGVLRLLVPSVAVGVIIDHRCVVHGVEVTH